MALTRSILACTAAATLALACAPASAAVIQNGSFEDIVVDWTANPDLVQTPGQFDHIVDGQLVHTFLPVDGSHLGVIQAGDGDTPVTIVQTFTTTGGLFSGWAAFVARDYMPYNDWGFVRLIHSGGTIDLFGSDIAAVGDFGYTPWTGFNVNLAAGEYTLEAGVVNFEDDLNASVLLVDAFQLAETAVPEPATWALMIAGFGLAGAALRRRRIASA